MPPTLFIRIANTLLAFDMLPYLWKLIIKIIGDWNCKWLKIDVYLWLIRSILCIIDVEREWARGSQCQVGKDDNLKRKQMRHSLFEIEILVPVSGWKAAFNKILLKSLFFALFYFRLPNPSVITGAILYCQTSTTRFHKNQIRKSHHLAVL